MLFCKSKGGKLEGRTVRQIAEMSGCSERSAQMALRDLERRGFIRGLPAPGKPTVYELLEPKSTAPMIPVPTETTVMNWEVRAEATGKPTRPYRFANRKEAEKFCRA
jgi:DNA-binding transcriptional MocR family regulator